MSCRTLIAAALTAPVVATLFVTGAYAQPARTEVPTLKEVTISATRTEKDVRDVAATVSVIDGKDVDRALVQGIADLIRYEPGVAVRRDPNRFGATDFNIRGLDGNRVLIQVDGIRVRDFFSFGIGPFNTATRNLIDIDSLKRVEILRGPSSSLYGSDALGGVVSYLTKDPGDYLSGGRSTFASIKGAFASADDAHWGTATGAGSAGAMQALVVYTYRRGHEIETKGDVDVTGPARSVANPQTFDGNSVLGKLVYRSNPQHAIKLTGEYVDTSVATDVLSLNASTPKTTSISGDDASRRWRASLDYEYTPSADAALSAAKAQVFWQDSATRSNSLETRANTTAGCSGVSSGANTCVIPREFTFDQSSWGLNAQLESRAEWSATVSRFVYGFDYIDADTSELRDATIRNVTTGTESNTLAGDRFPVRDFPNSTTRQLGVYVQDEILPADGRLSVIAALRYDMYKLEVKPDATYTGNLPPGTQASDFSDNAWSPKLAATWRLNERDVVYAQYAFGFRAPPFNDVNAGFRNPVQSYVLIPNPDLVSEKSRGAEIGLKGAAARYSYALAAFYNTYKDFIDTSAALTCPGDPRCVPGFAITFQSVNRGRVAIRGLEAKGEWLFTPQWSVIGAAAYAKGDDRDRDQPINSITPPSGVAGVRYTGADARYGATLVTTAVLRKKDIDQSSTPLFASPGFAIVDLTAFWSPAKNVTVNAGVFNLFDRKYWLWSDLYRTGLAPAEPGLDRYTQPGRNFSVNVSLAL